MAFFKEAKALLVQRKATFLAQRIELNIRISPACRRAPRPRSNPIPPVKPVPPARWDSSCRPSRSLGAPAFLSCTTASAALDPRFSQAGYAGSFYVVEYNASGWTYYSSFQNGWLPFTPLASDVLVASVGATGDGQVTALAGTSALLFGLQEGYQTGTLDFSIAKSQDQNGKVWYTLTAAAGSFTPFYLAQTTQYVYGTTATSASPDLFANNVLVATIGPDSTNSYGPGGFSNGSGGYDRVQYTIDRQGETLSMEDQNQTIHDYARDGVGRLLSDTIVHFGAGVYDGAGAVASIDYAYKVCGKLLTVSSEDASHNVLNQVQYQYDTNGNPVDEYQEHNGTVSTSSSLYVGYGYDDSTSVVNGVTVATTGYRPTTLQYPTTGTNASRVLTDSYGSAQRHEQRDQSTRFDHRRHGHHRQRDGLGATLDTLGYLGDGAIVSETYSGPGNEPNVGYNLLGTTSGQPDLDRFGRIVDQIWSDYGAGGKLLDGYGYTYNLQGDVAAKQNLAADAYKLANPSSTAPYLDEAYKYNQQDEVTALDRGQLTLDGTATWCWTPRGMPPWIPTRRILRRTGPWTGWATGPTTRSSRWCWAP